MADNGRDSAALSLSLALFLKKVAGIAKSSPIIHSDPDRPNLQCLISVQPDNFS
jgi:hypothetical protein